MTVPWRKEVAEILPAAIQNRWPCGFFMARNGSCYPCCSYGVQNSYGGRWVQLSKGRWPSWVIGPDLGPNKKRGNPKILIINRLGQLTRSISSPLLWRKHFKELKRNGLGCMTWPKPSPSLKFRQETSSLPNTSQRTTLFTVYTQPTSLQPPHHKNAIANPNPTCTTSGRPTQTLTAQRTSPLNGTAPSSHYKLVLWDWIGP